MSTVRTWPARRRDPDPRSTTRPPAGTSDTKAVSRERWRRQVLPRSRVEARPEPVHQSTRGASWPLIGDPDLRLRRGRIAATADEKDGDVLLDPKCGSARLAIERCRGDHFPQAPAAGRTCELVENGAKVHLIAPGPASGSGREPATAIGDSSRAMSVSPSDRNHR